MVNGKIVPGTVYSISAYGGCSGGSGAYFGGNGSAQLAMARSRHPPPAMPQDYGVDPNALVQGQPALIYAIRRGELRDVGALVLNGTSIDLLSLEHYNIVVNYYN